MVTSFYKSVEESPPLTDQLITDFMRQHSQVNFTGDCEQLAANFVKPSGSQTEHTELVTELCTLLQFNNK